jgi:hypothetical protein
MKIAMKKSRIAAVAAVLGWSLLTGVVFTLQAQGDSPIIINSSSLHLGATVPWSQFPTQGNTKSHPQANLSVPSIDVTIGGKSQTLDIGKQACQVEIKYGTGKTATVVTVRTGANGKGLSVTTDFDGSFQPGSDEKHLDHKDGTRKISDVVVTKAGQPVFQDHSPTGAVNIVVHYQP